MTDATATALSSVLRTRTRMAHERAEAAPFVADLLDGRLPIDGYAGLVVQNHAIYRALERHADAHRDDPIGGRVVFAELTRLPHLERDLAALLGPTWRDAAQVRIVPATHRYVEHLDATLPTRPGAFVAHHYVRYLGDLSGGQILRRGIERAYGPAGAAATAFYRFDEVGAVVPFRARYRDVLDGLPFDDAERDAVADEAVLAFELNRAVFDDLAAA